MFTRLIFLSVSLIFILCGVYALFFLDSDDVVSELKNRNIVFDKDKLSTYNLLIDKDSWAIRSTLDAIAGKCSQSNKYCVIMKVNNFLRTDILATTDAPKYYAQTILQSKKADRLDMAVLSASLLNAAGIDTLLALKGETWFTYICKVDKNIILREIKNEIDSLPMYSDTIALNNGKSYLIGMGQYGKNRKSKITATATGEFNMMIFPNVDEVDKYLLGKPYNFFPECSQLATKSADMECVIPNSSTLAFISKEMNNKISFALYNMQVELSDITVTNINNNVCVPFDPYDSNYPGVVSFDQRDIKVLPK